MSEALQIRNVSYAFGKRPVLKNVSFTVGEGGVTMLLGANGAGKTTLFSLIARLLDLQSGDISGQRQNLGVVFQQPAIDLELSVAQNLHYYAALHGLSRTAAALRMEDLLGPLDLASRKSDKVRSLNGGHRRRLEIARALMADPSLLLLDEPTSGLDIPTRRDLVVYLHTQAKERDIGVLWSTHLVDEIHMDDHVVILRKGEVVADGRAEDVVHDSGEDSLAAAFTRYSEAAA